LASKPCPACIKTPPPDYTIGLILPDSKSPGIADAIEIFKFLANMDSILDDGPDSRAWKAACILGGKSPGIADALEIFKLLAGMENVFEE